MEDAAEVYRKETGALLRLSGKYPYYRPLYIAHAPELGREAALFREWLLGVRGQQSIADSGTLNLVQGLALMGRFKFFGDTEQISNYKLLMERWSASEASREQHTPAGK